MFDLFSGDDLPASDFVCLFFVRDDGNHTPYVGYYSDANNLWYTYEPEGETFTPEQVSAWCMVDTPEINKEIEELDADSEGKALEEEAYRIALRGEPEYDSER